MSLALRRRSLLKPSSAFSPLSIPWHTAFWASGPEFIALGLSDGAAVTTLPDEASTNDATQATASKKPIYRASSATMNNKPIVEFDGVDDFLRTAGFTSLAQPNEIVVVARMRTLTASTRLYDGRSPGTVVHQMLVSAGGTQWTIAAGTGVTGGTADTSKHLFRAVYNGASSTLDQDGANIIAGSAGGSELDGISLAVRWSDTLFGAVDIAFYGLSGTVLTAQQRSDLLAWSRSFYATP